MYAVFLSRLKFVQELVGDAALNKEHHLFLRLGFLQMAIKIERLSVDFFKDQFDGPAAEIPGKFYAIWNDEAFGWLGKLIEQFFLNQKGFWQGKLLAK